jgi:hypothetical protein
LSGPSFASGFETDPAPTAGSDGEPAPTTHAPDDNQPYIRHQYRERNVCKIDVEFCNAPDLADHIEQMIFGLREAAPEGDSDDNEFQPYDEED